MVVITEKRIILALIFMTAFVAPFFSSSLTIALPTINSDLAVKDQTLLAWASASFALATAIFTLPFARISDKLGRKKVLLVGLSIFVVALFLGTICSSIYMLIAVRVMAGIGNAMLNGTTIAVLTAAFSSGERGKVLGIFGSSTYLGHTLGTVLGGFITQYMGWRMIFAGLMVYAVVVAVMMLWKLKGQFHVQDNGKFDLVGSMFYGATLFLLVYGVSEIPDEIGIYCVALSILGMVAFYLWEKRNENPILNVNVLGKNPVFVFSSLATLINYMATYAVAYMLSLYLQNIHGVSASNAGLILLVLPLVELIFSPVFGRISDRVPSRYVASIAMGVCAVGLISFAFITASTSLIQFVGSMLVLGIGISMFLSPNQNSIMTSVKKDKFATAGGIEKTMSRLGQSTSTSIVMIVFTLVMGHTSISRDPGQLVLLMNGIKATFVVFAIFCVIGMIFPLIRERVKTAPLPVARPQES
jgi:EmrB/QacA subfamily drug resistance transporter